MPTKVSRKHCQPCSKVTYQTQEQAWTAIGEMIRSTVDGHKIYDKIPCRVYECPVYAGRYHVTSQPERPR